MMVEDAESGSEFLNSQCPNLTREVLHIYALVENTANDGLGQERMFDASKFVGFYRACWAMYVNHNAMNTVSTHLVNPQELTYLHGYPVVNHY